MKEIFKPVTFKGNDYTKLYQISNLGRVKDLKKGIIKKPTILNDICYTVYLLGIGYAKPAMVHILVYEAFNGKIRKGYCIRHKDGNKFNNKLSNLIQVSRRITNSKNNGLPIGVTYRKMTKNYVSSIALNGVRITLGAYLDPIIAGEAYQIAYELLENTKDVTKSDIKNIVTPFRASHGLKPLQNRGEYNKEDFKPKHIVYKF